MTFIVFSVLAFLIVLVFKKYKTMGATTGAILLVFATTTAVLTAGAIALEQSESLVFFSSTIGRSNFFHLIALWYAADILCSILIVRNHIAYRKINTTAPKK